jgi:hypothetical protein
MHAKLAIGLTMLLSFGTAMVAAQDTAPAPVAAAPGVPGNSPDYSAVNCSGFIGDKVPDDLRVISGEQSNVKVIFSTNDYIYINRGRDKGVQVGDRFSVVRPEKDPVKAPWFKWQAKLLKAMGEQYMDLGQVRVVNVQNNVSVAQVGFACDYMQRGDILRPYVERPSPTYKDASTFDHFAPVNGKRVAMIVEGGTIGQASGRNTSVFVNLGTNQGVHMGDYYRIFRYQGTMAETVPQTKGYSYQLYGFGSAPAKYEWKDLPREVIGEGIVINASPNASTMLITYSSLEVYSGDYVEVE